MIRITKPVQAPKILVDKGKKERLVLSRLYTRFSQDYQTERRKFSFKPKIYEDASVKTALMEAQFGKCCYCETKIEDDGEIEHYRPQREYRQDKGQKRQYLGYYWLVYEWSNLLYACSTCNKKKGIWFPLQNPECRAGSHKDDIGLEQPLLINPAETDPARFISFTPDGETVPVDDNPIGHTTIDVLKLNRRALKNRRGRKFEKLRILHEVAHHDPPLKSTEQAKQILIRWMQDDSEDSAWARIAIDSFAETDS